MKILQNWNFLHELVILVLTLQLTSALQLEGLATKKPRTNKNGVKAPVTTAEPSSVSIYRVNATNGNTCMLIRTDGLLTIRYRDKYGEDVEADVYLPDHPEITGYCDETDEASVVFKFSGFIMRMVFEKTPGGERWYVPSVEIQYSSSNPKFLNPDRPNLNVKLSTPPHTFLFPTPIGKSFECMKEQEVVMYSQDENDKSGHLAKLLFRETRLQGFMYKATGQWGPPFVCSETGSYRDESAPFIMGTVLGLISMGLVIGYAVYRWKVKKYEYGNMA